MRLSDHGPGRIAITGMSVITPLGDSLEAFHQALSQGRPGLGPWRNPVYSGGVSHVGGDLTGYDPGAGMAGLESRLPPDVFRRARRIAANSPRNTALTLLAGADACADAGLLPLADPQGVSAILAGNTPNELYKLENWRALEQGGAMPDPAQGVKEMDTDVLACLGEALGAAGPAYSTGGACAAGNIALRAAMTEIRHHGARAVLVASPPHELTPASLHSLAALGALASEDGDAPERASRPFDLDRRGFVPAAGCAALVLEDLDRARERGARIHAEILGVGVANGGSRSPTPVLASMVLAMERALAESGLAPERIGAVSAHATSTVQGDAAEAAAIREVFGPHAGRLAVNALKSMLGHMLSASALVETVACVLELREGIVYPTINVERLDPAIGLDVCANRAVRRPVDHVLKNAFGFGGVNTACVLGRPA